jgi:hypothetical protein
VRTLTKTEKEYRDWLVTKLNIVKEDYTHLLRTLYDIEFFSTVKYDEDRGMDGMELRAEWAMEIGYKGALDWDTANVLEVFYGIAKRIEFQLFGTSYYDDWDSITIFWQLISNLGLYEMFGTLSRYTFDEINEKVSHFLNRDYFCHKNCNIFVFKEVPKNLQKLNIWSQMGLYVREKWPI